MGRSTKENVVVGAMLLAGLTLLANCGGPGDQAASTAPAPEEIGRVSLPLVTKANDHTYRLSNVYLSVSGPQYRTLTSSDDPGETELSATLQTGSYVAALYQSTLERDDGDGNFVPVPAALISGPYASFTIANGATSTISFQFQTDGVIVTVGSGDLKVKIAVDEIPAVCAPFGSDCPSGSWCPPTGLTGAPRACAIPGNVDLGAACLGPADCVANATCVDFGAGAGPVCAEICPSAGFDASCPSGGTCQRAAADYGVCTPATEITPAP